MHDKGYHRPSTTQKRDIFLYLPESIIDGRGSDCDSPLHGIFSYTFIFLSTAFDTGYGGGGLNLHGAYCGSRKLFDR